VALISVLAGTADAGRQAAKLPTHYRMQSARAKQQILLTRIETSVYGTLPDQHQKVGMQGLARLGRKLLPWNLRKSFSHKEDIAPPGVSAGPKVLHRFGTVGGVMLDINGKQYFGIARYSVAMPSKKNFIPGLALKLLRDNNDSHNLHVMDTPVGQGADRNFFGRTFRNQFVAPSFRESPAVWLLGVAFRFVKWTPNELPIPKALVAETGLPADAKTIEFRHTTSAQRLIAADSASDFRLELAEKIQPGLILSTLFVDGQEVGRLTATSSPIASEFGDLDLFFAHEK
jgi:hypothetical protein